MREREDSSSRWMFLDFETVRSGVIPPLGGGFGTIRGSYCPDSSSDWKDWDVGIADYVRFARVLHMRRAMVGLLFRAFVAFGEKNEPGFCAVL